jgi:PAS domain S-box-containing protein
MTNLNAAVLDWFNEQAQQGIFTCDHELRLRSWNRWLEIASGRPAAEVVGRPLFEVYPEIVARRQDRFFAQALQGESVVLAQRFHKYLLPLPVQGHHIGFTQMQQSVRLAPLLTDGQVSGVIAVIEDATERIAREEELRRQIGLHRTLHEIDQAILALDLPQCLQRVADSTGPLMGAALTAVVLDEGVVCRIAACAGCAEMDRSLPCAEDTLAMRAVHTRQAFLLADRLAEPQPPRMLAAESRSAVAAPLIVDGQVIGALVVESPRPHAFGVVEKEMAVSLATQAAVAIQNARLYTALREREAQYRLLADTARDIILTSDLQGRITYVNPAGLAIMGYTEEEAYRLNIRDIMPLDQRATLQGRSAARAAGDLQARLYETAFVNADGARVPVEVNSAPLLKEGNIVGVLVVARDITQRRRAAEQIRFQAHLLDVVGQAVIATDLDGKIIFWNRFAEQLYGWRADKAVGRNIVAVTVPAMSQAQGAEIMAALRQGARWSGEFTVQRRDGTPFPALVTDAPIHDLDGKLIGIVGISHDITERRQAEMQLRKTVTDLARSNADLQQFAYVASHDLQEPLRMVASYVQLLSIRYQGQLDADADEFIGYASEGAKRMQQLILDLLEYARVDTRGQPIEPTDMAEVCQIVAENLQVAIAETGAQVTWDPLPVVRGDSIQLGMVVQNLVGNALKFHGEAPPRVHISVRQTFEVSETSKVLTPETSTPAWEFAVHDSGIGIEPQYFERIFVIFQRLHTRREYPGTGMGLAICKKIIERHGGRIWLESAPGQGTTFYFTLPAV